MPQKSGPEQNRMGPRRAFAALTLLAGLLTACASPQTVAPPPPPPQVSTAPVQVAPPVTAAPADDRIRVGLLLPLTGRGAPVGQAMLDAAQMAVFDLADDRFLLLPRDTGGTPEGAVAAAQDALSAGAQLLLGPLFSADASAVKQAVAIANVPILSFSNDWTIAGQNLWVLGFQPRDQVRRVASFAAGRGIATFGALAPTTPYGDAAVTALSDAAAAAGGQVTRVERYTVGASDLTAVVRGFAEFERRQAELAKERALLQERGDEASKLALQRLANQQTFGELPYQAVLIAEGGQTLREVAALLPFFDVDPGPVRILGTGLWDEPGIGRELALVGGWYAAPAPEARTSFEARFADLYGQRPPRLATLAYDATAMAAALARSGDPRPFETQDLTNPNGFAGIDGIFRLLPGGQTERGLAVIEVTRRGSIVIDPAPQTFQPAAS